MDNNFPVQPPPVPPASDIGSGLGATNTQGQSSGSTPGKGDFVFKIVVVLAILSVLVLLGALGYYLYSASQSGVSSQNRLAQVVESPSPIPSPTVSQSQGEVLSESDETKVIESELTGTELEEFESEFTALLKEMEEL